MKKIITMTIKMSMITTMTMMKKSLSWNKRRRNWRKMSVWGSLWWWVRKRKTNSLVMRSSPFT